MAGEILFLVTAAELRELRRRPELAREYVNTDRKSLDLSDQGYTLEAALALLVQDGDPGLEAIITGFKNIGAAECPLSHLPAAHVADAARALATVVKDDFTAAVQSCAEGCGADLAEDCHRRFRDLAEFVAEAARVRRAIVKALY